MSHWQMPEEPDAIVFVIAPNYQWFENWCRIDNDPPLNHRDRRWRVFTNANDAQRLVRGRHKRPCDEVLWLGSPQWRGFHDLLRYALIPAGFTDCLDPYSGTRHKL